MGGDLHGVARWLGRAVALLPCSRSVCASQALPEPAPRLGPACCAAQQQALAVRAHAGAVESRAVRLERSAVTSSSVAWPQQGQATAATPRRATSSGTDHARARYKPNRVSLRRDRLGCRGTRLPEPPWAGHSTCEGELAPRSPTPCKQSSRPQRLPPAATCSRPRSLAASDPWLVLTTPHACPLRPFPASRRNHCFVGPWIAWWRLCALLSAALCMAAGQPPPQGAAAGAGKRPDPKLYPARTAPRAAAGAGGNRDRQPW